MEWCHVLWLSGCFLTVGSEEAGSDEQMEGIEVDIALSGKVGSRKIGRCNEMKEG